MIDDFFSNIWDICFVFVFSLLSGVALWLIFVAGTRKFFLTASPKRGGLQRAEEIGIISFCCLLGLTIGLLTGLSRESAVGAIVPAVLTLLGILVGYIYTSETSPEKVTENDGRREVENTKLVVTLSIGALTIFLLWGSFAGAQARFNWVKSKEQYEAAKELNLLAQEYEYKLQEIQYSSEMAKRQKLFETFLNKAELAKLIAIGKKIDAQN